VEKESPYKQYPNLEKLSVEGRIIRMKQTIKELLERGESVESLLKLVDHFKENEQYEAAEAMMQTISEKLNSTPKEKQ